MLLIASTFLDTGWIPCRVIQYPRYSSSSLPKKDFLALIFNPNSDKLKITLHRSLVVTGPAAVFHVAFGSLRKRNFFTQSLFT